MESTLNPAPSHASDPLKESSTQPHLAREPKPGATPTLGEDAFSGTAGHFVRTLAPHTEAHPAALLLQFLTAFGNLIGPGPHCRVGATRHALNLFVILVGDSSKARKGTSWNHIARLFAAVDPLWHSTRVNSARLNASGIVKTLRDQEPPTDRRWLAICEEFAAVLSSLKSASNHLSPLLRSAWDNGNLPTLGREYSQRATGAHISLIAHVTQHELARAFTHHQAHNGFANRCLWTWVERSNCLPTGGNPDAQELSAAARSVYLALVWANRRTEILFTRNAEAEELWADRYAALSYHQPGLRGVATSRGEAQVLRLSALYAALDSSDVIGLPHLRAAYAVWDYCSESATRLFGFSTGDPIADRIREAVEASPGGLNKTQIRRLFSNHIDSDRIDTALDQLAALGAVANCTQPGRGRPSIRWSTSEGE